MRVADALELGDRICDFLEQQGGAYAPHPAREVVLNVFQSLGSGDYVIQETNGEIDFFACFWRVHPEDVEGLKNRIKPEDLSHGSVMYVTEAASRVGLSVVVKALRHAGAGMKEVFWHRPAKQDKIYHFPSQRGEGA